MAKSSRALLERAHNSGLPEVDPAARPHQRTFTPEYRLQVLKRYESLREPGAKAALLRWEALYSSHVVEGLARQVRRGRSPEQAEVERLYLKNRRLETELKQTKPALAGPG